ncbi:hypothetical protein OH76DRAFT_896202 [Lentinus brumalis]|uniref:Uncharacterized protein n=1 Tax=Lentinus brumalis TaxID=2498619 RepID=A0A371D0L7_9APHY|nr:hypothetical protein OH76DRAFT_896202 [Polyporus brumalis]
MQHRTAHTHKALKFSSIRDTPPLCSCSLHKSSVAHPSHPSQVHPLGAAKATGQSSSKARSPASPPARMSPHHDFLQAVRSDNVVLYGQLMALLRRYQASRRAPISTLMLEVGRVFMHRPRFIEGFNAFLPSGYRIELVRHPFGPAAMTLLRTADGVVLFVSARTDGPA